MKLANALAERSNLQERLSELEKRLNNNAKVQAGEQPAEDPQALLKEFDETLDAFEKLVAQINLANSATVSDGVTLTEMLAKRDCLRMKLKVMRGFLDNASAKVDRYSKSEIAIRSTVSVKDLQKEVDDCSRTLRLLDEKIQELNWLTEI